MFSETLHKILTQVLGFSFRADLAGFRDYIKNDECYFFSANEKGMLSRARYCKVNSNIQIDFKDGKELVNHVHSLIPKPLKRNTDDGKEN